MSLCQLYRTLAVLTQFLPYARDDPSSKKTDEQKEKKKEEKKKKEEEKKKRKEEMENLTSEGESSFFFESDDDSDCDDDDYDEPFSFLKEEESDSPSGDFVTRLLQPLEIHKTFTPDPLGAQQIKSDEDKEFTYGPSSKPHFAYKYYRELWIHAKTFSKDKIVNAISQLRKGLLVLQSRETLLVMQEAWRKDKPLFSIDTLEGEDHSQAISGLLALAEAATISSLNYIGTIGNIQRCCEQFTDKLFALVLQRIVDLANNGRRKATCKKLTKWLVFHVMSEKVRNMVPPLLDSLSMCVILGNIRNRVWAMKKMAIVLKTGEEFLEWKERKIDVSDCEEKLQEIGQGLFAKLARDPKPLPMKWLPQEAKIFRFFSEQLVDFLCQQHGFENKFLRKGTLFASPFLQELCNLFTTLWGSCLSEEHPEWLTEYCVCIAAADSFINRTPIPPGFDLDKNDAAFEADADSEDQFAYLDHTKFTKEVDMELSQLSETIVPRSSVYMFGSRNYSQIPDLSQARVSTPTLIQSIIEVQPTQVECGADMTLVVTNEGEVFACGKGDYGRLGIGSTSEVESLTILTELQGIIITKVACGTGDGHCLALSQDGEVYSWGDGDYGKLGHGNDSTLKQPKKITYFTEESLSIKEICCGTKASAAITEEGALYTWGEGESGILGINDETMQTRPVHVYYVSNVTMVAMGRSHMLCSDGNMVWSCGEGDNGRLGLGDTEQKLVPTLILMLEEFDIKALSCGDTFSAILTTCGKVATFGSGRAGQLGNGSTQDLSFPLFVGGLLEDKFIVQMACGSNYMLALSLCGDVFAWGDNDYNQLGTTSGDSHEPILIPALSGKRISQLSCGNSHSCAVAVQSKGTKATNLLVNASVLDDLPSHSLVRQLPRHAVVRRALLLEKLTRWMLFNICFFTKSQRQMLSDLRDYLFVRAKVSFFKKQINGSATSKSSHPIPLRRHNRPLFYQICDAIVDMQPSDLRTSSRVWKCNFLGEGAEDAGGPYNESISQMCEELSGPLDILCMTPNAESESVMAFNKDKLLLNNKPTSTNRKKHLKFLGILLGLAIRANHCLNLNLAPVLWKQLAGRSLTLEDLAEVDRDFVDMVAGVRNINLDHFQGEFSYFESLPPVPQENPKAPLVHLTRETYLEWADLAIKQKLSQWNDQIKYVLNGLAVMVPVPLLCMFTESQLDEMACGNPTVDWELLKGTTKYDGINSDSDIAKWFWEVVQDFDNETSSQFLRFMSGLSRIPPGGPKTNLTIGPLNKQPADSYLPTAATCFVKLNIPTYSSKEILREKLLYAITTCSSIDTDDNARTGTIYEDNDPDGILTQSLDHVLEFEEEYDDEDDDFF